MSVAILGITITGLPEPDVTGNISVNTERFAKIETEIKSSPTEVNYGKEKLICLHIGLPRILPKVCFIPKMPELVGTSVYQR